MAKKKTRKEITIFKGFLECQFSDIKKNPLGSSKKNSKIKLEPRFKLTDVEIVDAFPLDNGLSENLSYIRQKDELIPVECHFKSKTTKPGRYFADDLLLLLKSDAFDANKNNIVGFNDVLSENKRSITSEPFLSSTYNKQHGKISGEAYFRIVKKFNEKNEEIKYTTTPRGLVIPISGDELGTSSMTENSGCLPFANFFGKIFKKIFNFNSRLKNYINTLSSKLFNKSIINDEQTNAGCLNSVLPSGCTSSGCSQFGCGCLSMLLAFAFLFWLIWCLLLGKCKEDKEQMVTDTKIIHDTVYIEVNKAKIDTIVKNDTIVYEDKTTKTKTSLVSLPNVQFEKNKSILLNSSKEDLDRLAKNLIENKQVKAEIIGHTDNTGEFETNLKLSQDRSESVRQYLIKKGVEPSRIKAVGKGESVPKTSNDSPEGRAMNRRVEVKLSETEKIEQTKKRIK